MRYLKMIGFVAVVAALMTFAGSASANPLTSPEGTSYTSTIKAESSNFKLHGPFVTVECSQSSFEGKVESHSTTTAGGKLSSWAFSGCNYPVEVKKPGSLELHATGAGNATVTSTGAEISIATSIGPCVFTTSATDTGTLTGSNATNATLDLSGSLPRTNGNSLCGSQGTLTGSYKVTTPGTLYVDS